MASIYDSLLLACLARLVANGLTGIATADIKRRMLPKVEETLDTLPCVIISSGLVSETVEPDGFEGTVNCTYHVLGVVIAASNQDYLTNEAQYLEWRQVIRRVLSVDVLTDVPTIWKVEVDPKPIFDASLLNNNYAYSAIGFRYQSHEQRD